jgi:uncharacterized protein YcbK (DUF882 family)
MAAPPGEQLRRIRKDLARTRRAPLRLLIASDPRRPVRTLVIPRVLPLATAIAAGALLLVAAGSSLISWYRGSTVDDLQGRLGSMMRVADDVARHPLPRDVQTTLQPGRLGKARLAVEQAHFEIESVNTGERLEVFLDLQTGELRPQSYRRLRHLMRCLRTGAETPVDPRLVELLYNIAQRTGQRIQLVSGFRAPMFSTADLSYHTRGMAADIRIPGMTPLMVRDLAESMGVGGIGYYPVSQFVHVDVRTERARWIDFSHDRGDAEGREHGADRAAPNAELVTDVAEPAAAPASRP